tara:strand:- start:303 stop:629 length:327 start_codon:yes stop_codon:yes gene_type:complete
MNKKEIQKKYKEKIKLFNELNKFYYDKSDPVASDKEYDFLKKEILLLETKHKFLKSNKSPSNTVGYKPSKNFKKVLHRAPMLSLSNAFSEEDLINFEKKNIKFLISKK